MTRFLLVAIAACFLASSSSWSQTTKPSDTQRQESTQALSSLQRLKMAAEGDANQRFQLLKTITPRGASEADRKEMVSILTGMLDSDYPDIRARAATALELFGSEAAPALPTLLKRINDKDTTIELEAVWVPVSKALSSIGPDIALEPLMKELATPEAATGPDREKYYGITAAISGMGTEAKAAAPVFVQLLRNGPENRRWATMFTLSKLGDAALPAIPDYIANLDHANFNMQVIACRALAELGPASAAAAPKLVELTKNAKMISTRTHAAMCLGAIGPTDNVDVDLEQLFRDMISESNAFSQERGLIALSRLGTRASQSASFIEEKLKDDDFSQIPEAARALWLITGDNKRPLEILESVIDDLTYDIRVYPVLHEMGADAEPLKDLLASKLATDDADLQKTIAETLAKMGTAAKVHLDKIEACLATAPPDVAIALDKAIDTIKGS